MSADQSKLRAGFPRAPIAPSFGWVPAIATIPFKAAGRLFQGNGGYPRGYHREGFPEHEMQQVMAGKSDRFKYL
jgi:hypothetical protein